MENLMSIKSLDILFAKLADLLGVGLDMIKANGMEYIMMYGEYYFWSKFIEIIFAGLFFGFLLGVVAFLVAYGLSNFDEKISLMFAVIAGVVVLSITMISMSLPYIMSPEMYSIQKVLELLK